MSSCDVNTILQLDQQLANLAQTACTGSTSSSSFLSSCCIPVLQLEIQINNAISGCPGYSSYASQMNTIISEMKSICKPDSTQSIPKTSYAVCTAMGDPHFIKFDRSYITYTQSGTITLIDNDYFSVIGTAAVRSPFTVPGFTSITVTYKHLSNMQQLTWTGNSVPTLQPSTFGDVGIHTLQISSGLTMPAISSMVTIDASGPYMSVTIFTAVGGSGACGSVAKPASLSSGVVASTFTPQTISSMVVQPSSVNSTALSSCKSGGVSGDFATACGYDYQASNMNSSVVKSFYTAFENDAYLYNAAKNGIDPTNPSSLGIGGIVGIAVGCLLMVIFVIACVVRMKKRKSAAVVPSKTTTVVPQMFSNDFAAPQQPMQSVQPPPQYVPNTNAGFYAPQNMQPTAQFAVQQSAPLQQPARAQMAYPQQSSTPVMQRPLQVGSTTQVIQPEILQKPLNQGTTQVIPTYQVPTYQQPVQSYQQPMQVYQQNVPATGYQQQNSTPSNNIRRKSIETIAMELNIPGLLTVSDIPVEQLLAMKYNELQPRLGLEITPEQYMKLKAYKKEYGL